MNEQSDVMMLIKNMWFLMRFQKKEMNEFTRCIIHSKQEVDLCIDEEIHQKQHSHDHADDGVLPDIVMSEVKNYLIEHFENVILGTALCSTSQNNNSG